MATNKLYKTPAITKKTKILCFDLETNGLHGQAFAIGALVIDASGKVNDEFVARTKAKGKLDPWVKENVLPSIADMAITHKSFEELKEAFWQWYVAAEEKSDYVLVDNGYPVEFRFFLQCQEDNIKERYWQHPFPFVELSSLIMLLGGETTKKQMQREAIDKQGPFRPHHPLDDAKVSALVAFEALQKGGRIKAA